MSEGVKIAGHNYFTDIDPSTIDGRLGEWELRRPARNVVQVWTSKVAETQHRMIQIITGQNDYIDGVYGGAMTPFSIQIPEGLYAPLNLAAQLDALLKAINSDFSSGYDTSTKKFSVTNSTQKFTLNASTGTHRSQSAMKTLGFDCSTDPGTGGSPGTVTADYARTSTWGSMAMKTGANVLKISGTNVTIPVADYNLMTFCTAAIDAINTAKSWTVDVDWNESTKKFRYKRVGGAATWSFSDAASTITPVVGHDTTDETTADGVYTSGAHSAVCIHSTAKIFFPASSGAGATDDFFFFLRNTNLSPGSTVKLIEVLVVPATLMTGTVDSEGNVTVLSNGLTVPGPSELLVEITDPTNPAGFVSVGVAAFGKYDTLDRGVEWDQNPAQFWTQDYSTQSQADYGQTSVTIKPPDRGITMAFEAITPADRAIWEALQNEFSTGPGWLLMMDFENHPSTLTFYVRLTARIVFTDRGVSSIEPLDAGFNNYDCSVSVVESK